MSFTPPTTVASQANTGYLSQFLIGSPPVAIAEIKSFSVDGFTMSEISTTHLLSPNNTEEFIPSMLKPGKLSASGNFLADATQLGITPLAQGQTISAFTVTSPVQRNGKTYHYVGSGFISSYKVGPFENNKPIEFQIEIQSTGAFVESAT